MNRTVLSFAVVSLLLLSVVPVGVYDAVSDDLDEIPESYDMRDYYDVGDVRDQGNYGTCWCFAACESMGSMLRAYGVETIISPLYFGEQTYTGFGADYEPGQRDEIRSMVDGYEIGYSIGENGYDQFSIQILSNWLSPIPEEALPYSILPKSKSDLEIQIMDPTLLENTIGHITEAVMVDQVEDRDVIKSLLMEGYVGAFAYAVDRDLRILNDGYYTFISDPDMSCNHEVALIGWDDNYPKENFSPKFQPENDGAWLIKNSWGESDEYNGYGWVSYECGQQQEVIFYLAYDSDIEKNLYSYDRCYSVTGDIEVPGDSFRMCNIFTSEGAEILEDVSFATYNVGCADYTVSVYLDPTDPNDPTSGRLVSKTGGSFDHMGLHTVHLGQKVKLNPGQVFAVCVEFVGEGLMVPVDTYEAFECDGVLEFICDPIASEGQSFVDIGDGWEDISSDGKSNVRVKAVTVDDNGTDLTIPVICVCIFGVIVVALAFYFIRRY